MFIHRHYTEGIAQASYYIESNGVAAVIDPFRDPQPYLELATERGAIIKYVFETHFHTDFVSGHFDLSKATGAQIIYGPGSNISYPVYAAADREEWLLGNINVKLLHTPGHTPDSCCFLLLDEKQMPHSVFTGDTLLVDDVGRPDVYSDDNDYVNRMAGELYDSLQNQLISLPNYVVVYPGHGMGSYCAKNIGPETFSTIGSQKKRNFALQATSRDEFILKVTEGLSDLSGLSKKYFNNEKSVPVLFQDLMKKNCNSIDIGSFKKHIEDKDIVLLDTRHFTEFSKGFIPFSINIGYSGLFGLQVALMIEKNARMIIIGNEIENIEIIKLLTGVGFENIIGFLDGGFSNWKSSGEKIDLIQNITASDFALNFNYNTDLVVDVRKMDEWIPGIVAGAKLIPLDELEVRINELNKDKTCYMYCSTGYRSVPGISILKKHGFKKAINILGGMESLTETSISIKQLSLINN